jgi:diphthine synthase
MALFLIGAGVSFDITLKGLEAIRTCEEAFIETYTNPLDPEKVRSLEIIAGKSLTPLDRSHLESSYLVDKAESSDVCLIASGDPLTATTHVTLVIEAKKRGVPVHVIHNSSIHSVAPARAGLQIYRFGKTASLVNPRPNYKPTSSLDIIRENLARNLHTLVLLDTEPQPMDAKTALGLLGEFDSVVVLSRVGLEDEKISFGKIKDLEKSSEKLGKPPLTIIVPAKLHPIEEEYLEALR